MRGLMVAGLLLVAANAAVSLMILFSGASDRQQKRMQLLFVWLLPVAGAWLAWHLLHEDLRPGNRMRERGNAYLEWSDPGSTHDQAGNHGQADPSSGHDHGA